jgi:hypothetical protein
MGIYATGVEALATVVLINWMHTSYTLMSIILYLVYPGSTVVSNDREVRRDIAVFQRKT